MMNQNSFFQSAKIVLNTLAKMRSEKRCSAAFSNSIEKLEERQMMTATGFENEIQIESEPCEIVEMAPVLQTSAVSVRGVTIRINGQNGYVSASSPTVKLNAGDYLEVVSVDLHVNDSLENQTGIFALEGYGNKIDSFSGPSSIDYQNGRFSARDSVRAVEVGDLSMDGLDGGWNIENGWDRITLSLIQYYGNESNIAATFSIKTQVGTPEFEFGDDVHDLADQSIVVGDKVNIVGSWLNSGEGKFHNYAEVDVFFEDQNSPSWVGVLVGNADQDGGVTGEFLFPAQNGDRFTERWTPDKAGTYRIEFTVDPENLWSESNELNNRIQLEIVVSAPGSAVDIGNSHGGVVGQDLATGDGFIMYSKQDINERFTDPNVYHGKADHFVNVRFHEGVWQYESNQRYVDFEPEASDVLVASVDYASDKVKSLKGQDSQFNGIQLGFAQGDRTFEANVWNGNRHDRDFGLTETSNAFLRNSENPVEFCRQTIAFSERTEAGSVVGQLKAVGGDSETSFHVVGGDQKGKIKIDRTGQVYLADKIDFKLGESFKVLIEARRGTQVSVAELTIKALPPYESAPATPGHNNDGVPSDGRPQSQGNFPDSNEKIHDHSMKNSKSISDWEHFSKAVNPDGFRHHETKGANRDVGK